MRKIKILGLVLVLAALLCGCTDSEPVKYNIPEVSVPDTGYVEPITNTDNTVAQKLTAEASHGDGYFTDSNYYTARKLKEDTPNTVTPEEGTIGSLYVVWNRSPERWWLTAGETERLCGEYGFLHEYILLDEPVDSVTLHVPAGSELCDIYALSPGAAPDWVQIWEPSWDKADLLAIPTHADDEVVFFGGLLPYYAVERGLKVQVVYMTDHYSLEPHRNHELLACMWNMGLRNYPVVGPFKDRLPKFASVAEAKQFLGWDKVKEFQVELLRRFQPSVVVTHDLEGEYGHPAHIVTATAMTEAVELAKDAANYPASAEKYGTWDTPKLYIHLYGEHETSMDWNKPMEAFGGLTGYEVAELGWEGHASQRKTSFQIYKDEDLYAGNLFGLYRTNVGQDEIGGDLFENIKDFY